MPRSAKYQRIAWEDRFNVPQVSDLRAALDRDAGRLFDALRRQLIEPEDVSEELAWYGECWKWSIEYRLKGAAEPVALLIPSPSDLQLAMPLDRELAENLQGKPFKRAVRDGLELAQEPFDTHWSVWSVQHANLVGDLQKLIRRKLEHANHASST